MKVEYVLRDLAKRLGAADCETRLVEVLPDDLKRSLPTIAELEAKLEGAVREDGLGWSSRLKPKPGDTRGQTDETLDACSGASCSTTTWAVAIAAGNGPHSGTVV